jgi:hypothetical protein
MNTRKIFNSILHYLLIIWTLCPAATLAQVNPAIQIADTPMAMVFDFNKDRCTNWDIPDAPLRAYRAANGNVVAFASGHDNRPFIGPSLGQIVQTCHPSLVSKPDPDPALYDGMRYVTATWTKDGVHVAAVIHNEYHAERFGKCSYAGSLQCWYNTILAAFSDDSGQTFSVGSTPRVIAALPFAQEVDQGRHRGFFNPSNILFRDGYWYMAVHTTGGGTQHAGTCLFRSTNVDDPESWKSFSGREFDSVSIDPYRGDKSRYVPCQPMTNISTLGSISYYANLDLYLCIFQNVDPDHLNGSIAYAWSKDMLHWGPHTVLLNRPDMSSKNCLDNERYGYPSVLDAQAPGRNFDSISQTPYLFLTQFHVKNCKLTSDRDLVRFQLIISR